MMKPVLYLLLPAEERRMFCPESALLEGVLTYYPAINQAVEVRRIGLPRPRPELVELLGEENQSAPVLVFPKTMDVPGAARTPSGLSFLGGPAAIVSYFAGQGLSGRSAS
jgi:hypothetical protein